MSCLISKNNIFDCAAVTNESLKPELILINFEDYKAATVAVDGTSKQITDIALVSPAVGFHYVFPKNSSVLPTVEMRENERSYNAFQHSVDVVAFQIGQTYREDIAKMLNGLVVAIVIRNSGVGEVYGAGNGLRMNAFSYAPGTQEGSGVMQFTLATPTNTPGEIAPGIEVAAAFDFSDLYA